jgi:hypothetical protein
MDVFRLIGDEDPAADRRREKAAHQERAVRGLHGRVVQGAAAPATRSAGRSAVVARSIQAADEEVATGEPATIEPVGMDLGDKCELPRREDRDKRRRCVWKWARKPLCRN